MDATHPSDEMLYSYGLGQLDDGVAGVIKEHLGTCASCRSRAAALSSNSDLDWRQGLPKGARRSRTEDWRNERSETASFLPPHDSPSPGLIDCPDYEIRKELGRGGMGVVYLARNTLMGRDEVLKVMGRQLMSRPESLDRFLREIRAVAKLRHPNIVSAYSAFRHGESLVFAMEYVEGLDLARMVRAKGPLPVAHASHFIYQTALGLQHAHEEGLVHRDIKPGNLMLARKGTRATVKILDFGLAKATRDEKLVDSLTADGQALGTPAFIAPEQIKDSRSADIRADIYGLGATLYYLLTGRPPFPSESLYELFQAHLLRDADPLDLVRPDVPPGLAALVARMMAKDPAGRPQTPKELAEALAPFFKKADAAHVSPKAVIPPAGVAFDATRPEGDAAQKPVGAETVTETPAGGSRWESLIDFRDEEDDRHEAPAVDPGQRPFWKTWPALAAASLLGLVALGLAVYFAARDPQRGEIPVARAEGVDKKVPVRSSKPEKKAVSQPAGSTPSRSIDPDPASAKASPTPPPSRADDKPPAVAKADVPAAAAVSSALVNALRSETRSVYVDDFDNPESGWPRSRSNGYSAGAYFVASDGPWENWRSPRRVRTDSILEVVGQLKSEGPIARGSWAVIVTRMIGEAHRGFMVTINGKGELFLLPNPRSREPIDADPTLGPIVHPAIKPGGQTNRLLIAMKKRSLEVFVNSARVCGPLTFTYDLTPSTFGLGTFDGPGDFRAEFERVEVCEFSDGGPWPSPTPDDTLRTSTRQVYVDDFSDPASGWPVRRSQGLLGRRLLRQPGGRLGVLEIPEAYPDRMHPGSRREPEVGGPDRPGFLGRGRLQIAGTSRLPGEDQRQGGAFPPAEPLRRGSGVRGRIPQHRADRPSGHQARRPAQHASARDPEEEPGDPGQFRAGLRARGLRPGPDLLGLRSRRLRRAGNLPGGIRGGQAPRVH